MQCNALHLTALPFSALHCTAPRCTALYVLNEEEVVTAGPVFSTFSSLHSTILKNVVHFTVQCTALDTNIHCTSQHWTLHYRILKTLPHKSRHYTTQSCTLFFETLHCTLLRNVLYNRVGKSKRFWVTFLICTVLLPFQTCCNLRLFCQIFIWKISRLK